MPLLQELERANENELAALCQRVADNRAAYLAADSEEASKLKSEWTALQLPPNLNYAIQTKIEQRKAHLRRRMVGFLAGIL
jgi:glutamate/tyrosine decarboxylase-like PLP-dependent enzyme